ncbi:YugN-like family protein [Alkalihalobacillus sp. 1P02AB]|uniref:YugN-like family protein n=1 Tax=Alkalihalobacillus sp. 1P02AB TaxID=3132260 RepID=UPI0039A76DFF
MLALPSAVEGKQFKLKHLEDELKPLGYSIGGNWDYDHGFFDYKIDQQEQYIFFRLPFKAIDGELDQRGVSVELGQPFLLAHEYQSGIDNEDTPGSGVLVSSINQFSSPTNKDAEIPSKFMTVAQNLISELELTLLR